MAHFANVVNGLVRKVHVVSNAVITDGDGVEQESLGQQFLADLYGYNPSEVIQCSYNGAIRGAYPGTGWSYDAENDVFVEPVEELTDGS